MAAALIPDPSLLCSLLPPPTARCSLSAPGGKLRLHRKPALLPVASPCAPSPYPCAAGTLDPQSADESPAPSLSTRADGRESGKDRRRVVRIAWEKLVRWSRSWRSKSKGDVLERTKKVPYQSIWSSVGSVYFNFYELIFHFCFGSYCGISLLFLVADLLGQLWRHMWRAGRLTWKLQCSLGMMMSVELLMRHTLIGKRPG